MPWIKRHFGKVYSIALLTVILGLNFMGLNLSTYSFFSSFNNLIFLLILITFFVLLLSFRNKMNLIFKIGFLFLLFGVQGLIISKFLKYVKDQNTNVSISEKNAAISLSWTILVPTLIIVFLALGVLFDHIRGKNKSPE